MSDIIKLTVEQGDLAFAILDLMEQTFPENPEKNIPILELLLESLKEGVNG